MGFLDPHSAGSSCTSLCRGWRRVAELEKAEYCCPNDARRDSEGEAVDEGNKAEVHHVQRDPDYGHRCGIFHKVVLVVVPGLYPQVTPIFEEKDRRSGKRKRVTRARKEQPGRRVPVLLVCWSTSDSSFAILTPAMLRCGVREGARQDHFSCFQWAQPPDLALR